MNKGNDRLFKKLLIAKKIHLVSNIVNVTRTVWRIWILMLGCKKLSCANNKIWMTIWCHMHILHGLFSSLFWLKKKLPVKTNKRNHFLEACKANAGTASYWPSSSLSLCFLASSSSRFRLASISLRCLSSSSFRCFQVVYSLCLASDMCCSLVLCPDNCCALVLRSWKYDCFIYRTMRRLTGY